MRSVRAPTVAGHHYPAEAEELTAALDSGVTAAGSTDVEPVAVIAPHAGYRWSGPVAASAHAALAGRATPIERVVVAGPTHKVSVKGIGVSTSEAFATPLGNVRTDIDAIASIVDLPGVAKADRAHAREYSVEAQLPFIQRLLGDIPIVPLLVGSDCPPWMTADVFERLCRDDRTALVVSSDMSHHHESDHARRVDRSTTDLIEQLDVGAIGPDRMCGAGAVRGLLKTALRRQLDVQALDVRNSGDFGADPARVVGYGAFAFSDPGHRPPADDTANALQELAVTAARHRVRHGEPLSPDSRVLPPSVSARGAAFVSVSVRDAIRGCIGRVEATDPIGETVAWAAGAAVEGRAWFEPVETSELEDLSVEVQVLSPLSRLHADTLEDLAAALRPGEDGLVIAEQAQRATYLPTVWEEIGDPVNFVTGLLAKGGFEGPWTRRRAAYRYSTTVLGRSA